MLFSFMSKELSFMEHIKYKNLLKLTHFRNFSSEADRF